MLIHKEQELKQVVTQILTALKNQRLLCLYGDLGSGKTTFVKYLAKALNLKVKVKSPSYVIMNIYKAKDVTLYHIDFYRLTGQDPYTAMSFEEILADKNGIVVIEWADLVESYLPKERIEIHFKNLGAEKRELEVVIPAKRSASRNPHSP